MSRSKTYPIELKNELLEKLRNGQTLSNLSKEYGIAVSTISGWLGRSAKGKKGDELEIGPL